MMVETIAVDQVMVNAQKAFHEYKTTKPELRARFLLAIAEELQTNETSIVHNAQIETHLPEARLKGEMQRTIFQLKSFANLIEAGDWLRAVIDLGNPDRKPAAKPDIRKTFVPVGPVVVFGASNFPLAFSTAGGDTASALAAGCSVIVKSHPAHQKTSASVASAIRSAMEKCGVPDFVFQHVDDGSHRIGQELVTHPVTKSVSFTGSYAGGKALFDLANLRPNPIPVFAEMGSINPLVILPHAMSRPDLAELIANSVLLGVGQFCTNPGLIIAMESDDLPAFIGELTKNISRASGGQMLHAGIAESFRARKERALHQPGVQSLVDVCGVDTHEIGYPAIAAIESEDFLTNETLAEEVFGPFSLIVKCKNMEAVLKVLRSLQGQLTATIFGSMSELQSNPGLMPQLQEICGRLIYNGVPTGVEVCAAMHHGGPFPASTDSRFTSVGTDAIYRFVRPVTFQDFPDHLLPDELQNSNARGVLRCVNNEWTRRNIQPASN
jgi:2,5-dioxopentanoate dehydrogenase